MKRISLSILVATLIFSLGTGEAFATALATTAVSLGTGSAPSLDNGSLSRQTAAITFTTSSNVYLTVAGSAATSAEYFTVSGGHLNGDKEYAMGSSGGGVYWRTKTAGSSTLAGAPLISTTGVMTTTGWTAQ